MLTVSFSGADIDPAPVLEGYRVEKPTDPVRADYVFDGWFSDEGCTIAYDFEATVSNDITLYAKWVPAVNLTLNPNYDGAPEAVTMVVGAGLEITNLNVPIRVGYIIDGWYQEAECINAFDSSSGIVSDTTIYAKWAQTSIYKFTATRSADRFQLRFRETSVSMLELIKPGDVISFMVRFTSETTSPSTYRLRTRLEEMTICDKTVFDDPSEDGWYTILVIVPDSFSGGSGLYLQLFGYSLI